MALESYLTYEEYTSFGGKVSEDAFPVLERKARHQLDYITFNRIHYVTVIPDIVKEVLAEFIDRINEYENTAAGVTGATSYSNGIETFSFDNNSQSKFYRDLYKEAVRWLPNYLIARSVSFDAEQYIQSDSNNP